MSSSFAWPSARLDHAHLMCSLRCLHLLKHRLASHEMARCCGGLASGQAWSCQAADASLQFQSARILPFD